VLRLTVKNFGILKNIDVELRKTNLFIGDNGSGKSTLAKLIIIVTDFTLDETEILQRLKDFNIDFFNKDCVIEVKEDDLLILSIVGLKINFSKTRKNFLQTLQKHETTIAVNNLMNAAKDEDILDELINKVSMDNKDLADIIIKLKNNKKLRNSLTNIDRSINHSKSKYIPAERNLISLFNQSLSNIINAKIPLPKILLEFSSEYNSARNEIKELDILNMKYKNENSNDRIYYESNNSLALENSSSGIQSALPLYLTLKYFATKHKNIIIEEPELNLYPESQIDTIKYIIENRQESSLTIMTHSPYILSILNVLLFAHKAANTNPILKEKISNLIQEEQQIDPNEFCAYLIEHGVSKNIKGKSTGMIQENAIDDIGGLIDNEFNDLIDIYSEFKSDK